MENNTNLVWIEQFSVHASDTDYRSKGKLSFILDIMQRAADSAVGNLGISMEEILNAGMGWMMITLDLEFKRSLRPSDLLNVQTWSKGTKGALWQRDYRIFDGEGIEIATSRSIWALVDIERKILRPNALPVQVVHYNGDSVGDFPAKLSIPSDISMEKAYSYKVRYSGLDNNGHLNNARYGDLCCDALSLSEWDTTEITRFRITYIQEAKFGDEMTILRSPVTDGGIYVRGENSDAVFFEACIELEDTEK